MARGRELAAASAARARLVRLGSSAIRSLAFSAIITTGALVLPDTSVGMIEQSTTRRPGTPCTRSRSSTTASGSAPILHVPDGWKIVAPYARANASRSASDSTALPGRSSSTM